MVFSNYFAIGWAVQSLDKRLDCVKVL